MSARSVDNTGITAAGGLGKWIYVLSGEASTAIAAGDCLVLDYSTAVVGSDAIAATFISTAAEYALAQTFFTPPRVLLLPTGVTTGVPVFAIAAEAIAAGAQGAAWVDGLCPKVHISDGDVAAGDPLIGDGETAGEAEKYVIGTHTTALGPFGYALTSDTTNDGFVAALLTNCLGKGFVGTR